VSLTIEVPEIPAPYGREGPYPRLITLLRYPYVSRITGGADCFFLKEPKHSFEVGSAGRIYPRENAGIFLFFTHDKICKF